MTDRRSPAEGIENQESDLFFAGLEERLAQTIEAAKRLKAVRLSDLKRVVVDCTVQEKDVAFPTDSRLLEVAWHEFIPLLRKHARVGLKRVIQDGRCAHSKQF